MHTPSPPEDAAAAGTQVPRADGASAPARVPRSRTALAWSVAGSMVFLLGAAWSVALPLMASPDEPSHVVNAAAVVRGQWDGELGADPVDATRPGAGTIVELPSDYAAIVALPNCFAFQSDVPAACQQDIAPPDGSSVPVETFAGQYPPLYYLLVGWPSLFLSAEAAVFGMRLVGAALAAGFLTWGAARVTRTLGARSATWAIAAAVTPMCLFLGGTVNPQGLEVATAFSFWAACLALALGTGPPSTGTFVQVAVSGAVLVNVRASSPVWAVGAVVVALILAPPGRWREVLRQRSARWVGLAGALASIGAVSWLATHPAVTGGGLFPEYADLRRTVPALASHTYEYLLNMVGNFGWLDSPAPPATYVSWFVAGGALVLLGLGARTSKRKTLALVVIILGVLGAPFVLQIPTAADTGLIWQGRYVLPLAVGVPLVAAALLATEREAARDLVHRVGRLTLPLFAVAQVAAFWWAARRYSEGMAGEVVTRAPDWSSPIGYLPGVAAYALVVAVLAALAWRATGPGSAPGSDVDASLAEHEGAVDDAAP